MYLAGVSPETALCSETFAADVAVERSVLQPLDLRDKTAVTLLYQPAYVHSSNKQCTAESEPESYIKFQVFDYVFFFLQILGLHASVVAAFKTFW